MSGLMPYSRKGILFPWSSNRRTTKSLFCKKRREFEWRYKYIWKKFITSFRKRKAEKTVEEFVNSTANWFQLRGKQSFSLKGFLWNRSTVIQGHSKEMRRYILDYFGNILLQPKNQAEASRCGSDEKLICRKKPGALLVTKDNEGWSTSHLEQEKSAQTRCEQKLPKLYHFFFPLFPHFLVFYSPIFHSGKFIRFKPHKSVKSAQRN